MKPLLLSLLGSVFVSSACGNEVRHVSVDDDGGGAGGDSTTGAGGEGTSVTTAGVGAASSVGGAPTTSGGGVDCPQACSDLYDCGVEKENCPGFSGDSQEKEAFVAGCTSSCHEQPLLIDLVEPNDCPGTIANLKGVSAQFSEVCENGFGSGGASSGGAGSGGAGSGGAGGSP